MKENKGVKKGEWEANSCSHLVSDFGRNVLLDVRMPISQSMMTLGDAFVTYRSELYTAHRYVIHQVDRKWPQNTCQPKRRREYSKQSSSLVTRGRRKHFWWGSKLSTYFNNWFVVLAEMGKIVKIGWVWLKLMAECEMNIKSHRLYWQNWWQFEAEPPPTK